MPTFESPIRGKLVSANETGKMIGKSGRWVVARINDGTLPFMAYFIGFEYKCDTADIYDFLRKAQIPAGEKMTFEEVPSGEEHQTANSNRDTATRPAAVSGRPT